MEKPIYISINVCLISGCRKANEVIFFFLTVKNSIALIKALPDMFPSPVAPPKKLGHASEAMLHILEVRKTCMYENFLGMHDNFFLKPIPITDNIPGDKKD